MNTRRLQIMAIALAVMGTCLIFHPVFRKSVASQTNKLFERSETHEILRSLIGSDETAPSAISTAGIERIEELDSAFFLVTLDRASESSQRGLTTLAAALMSNDQATRLNAAPLVESLLVRVAHGALSVDSRQEEQVRALFRLYKDRAP